MTCALVFLLFCGSRVGVSGAGDSFARVSDAVEFLRPLGLSVPVGEYREVVVEAGDVWSGETNIVNTRGWVSGMTNVVCWNGLSYRPRSVGPRRDLAMDVETLPQQRRWNSPFSESTGLSFTNLLPMKAAMLLAAGKASLAKQAWEKYVAAPEGTTGRDPVLLLATDWTWALFDRAVCAHMRGDDRVALADSRVLKRIYPLLETEFQLRGLRYTASGGFFGEAGFLGFLPPVKGLLEDQERRARSAPVKVRSPASLRTAFPNQDQRIPALIAQLEEMKAHQMGQPGGLLLSFDPTFKTLCQEGEAAVPFLIECAETDRRMTRSVSFHRDFFPHREFLTARSVALSALTEILRVSFQEPGDYRAYWENEKGVEISQRWRRTLMNDEAGRQQWLQAAENILARVDGTNVFSWKWTRLPGSDNPFSFAGEKLRQATNPSVSDLLGRRAVEIAPASYVGSLSCWEFEDAANLALMLAQWDTNSATAVLEKVIRRCPALLSPRKRWTTGCSVVSEQFARLAVVMANFGDTTGLDLYAGWIGDGSVADVIDGIAVNLSPLARFPNHPSIQNASEKLFHVGRDDWKTARGGLSNLRLMNNSKFRSFVLHVLDDRTELGSITVQTTGEYEIVTKVERGGGTMQLHGPIQTGKPVQFRNCDDIANRLTRIKGMPPFQLYWTEPMRDEAIVAIRTFLKSSASFETLPGHTSLSGELAE